MSYFVKDSINVFPSSYRKQVSGGNFTSEKNFVNIINSIVDRDCYVLSTEASLRNGNPLQVVLHGYYFEIENFTLGAYPTCRVGIKVEKGAYALVNFENTATQSKDIDVNSEFKGLIYSLTTDPFNNNDTAHYDVYQLQVSEGGHLVNQVRLSSDSIFDSTDDRENNPKSVSDTLAEKQNKVLAGNGLKADGSGYLLNDKAELIDKYNTTLDSMKSGVGSGSKPVYVKSDGKVTPIDTDSGSSVTSGIVGNINYIKTQSALITGGELKTSGVSFYASQDQPPANIGANGDFWFKYTA